VGVPRLPRRVPRRGPGVGPTPTHRDPPGAEATTDPASHTTTTFEFKSLDDDTRTLVTITESSWQVTADGAQNAFGNCEGWTTMLSALKAWLEHGINLREGFYV